MPVTVVVCFSRTDADDVDGLVELDHATLDAAGDDRAATGDREHVLDRHQERLVGVALGLRDVAVDRVHQLHDRLAPLLVAVQRREGGHAHDGDVVAVELLLVQQLAHLELDQLEDLLVVDHVALVEGYDHRGYADLAGQQHVLTGLRHRAVGGGDHEDRAVHLRSTRDHVLHVVGVTGAVDVRVVPVLGLVLHVRDRDRDAALPLLRRLVDLVEGREGVQLRMVVVQHLRDRRGQSGLPVVDVADGADVDVRLSPLELGLRHFGLLLDSLSRYAVETCCCGARWTCWPSSLAPDLLDNLVGDVLGNLGVRVELHGVHRTPLRLRTQVANVSKHL